jgi:hypothetical protein
MLFLKITRFLRSKTEAWDGEFSQNLNTDKVLSMGARGESRARREQVRLGGLARRGEHAEEGAGGALDLMERSMRVVISVISNSRWVSRPCT